MKAALFRLHRYMGLVAAAFLLVQALSGITIVFGAQVAGLVDPAGMVSSPGSAEASPARLLANAEARYPAFHASRVVYPTTADGTYLVHFADEHGNRRYVSLDRHNGHVLREGGIWRFPVVAALYIHHQWLAGRFGTIGVSLTGLSLLLIAGTGISFWWPRRGRLAKGLVVRWDASGRIVLRQLHRTVGVIISTLLGLMAMTGLLVELPRVLAQPPPDWTTTEPFAPRIEPALQLAERRFPGRPVRDVLMLGPTMLAVFFLAPERDEVAVHRVIIDTSNMRVLSVRNAADIRETWVIALPLHSGRALGTAGRLLVLLTGLSLAVLAVSGPLMWAQAPRRRRSPPRKAPARGNTNEADLDERSDYVVAGRPVLLERE